VKTAKQSFREYCKAHEKGSKYVNLAWKTHGDADGLLKDWWDDRHLPPFHRLANSGIGRIPAWLMKGNVWASLGYRIITDTLTYMSRQVLPQKFYQVTTGAKFTKVSRYLRLNA
jgi:hypothetical protein